MSRNTKLTPERQAKFIQAILMGNYRETSARYAGIEERTVYYWIDKGKKEKSGIYFQFFQALKNAEAKVEAANIGIIRKAADGYPVKTTKSITKMGDDNKPFTETTTTESHEFSWQAAAWYLERKHFKKWGRKERREITGKDGKPIEQNVNKQISSADLINMLKDPEAAKAIDVLVDKFIEEGLAKK